MKNCTYKFLTENPLLDCKRLNYENNKNISILVMIMDNKICTLQMEFSQSKLRITPLTQQTILNDVKNSTYLRSYLYPPFPSLIIL